MNVIVWEYYIDSRGVRQKKEKKTRLMLLFPCLFQAIFVLFISFGWKFHYRKRRRAVCLHFFARIFVLCADIDRVTNRSVVFLKGSQFRAVAWRSPTFWCSHSSLLLPSFLPFPPFFFLSPVFFWRAVWCTRKRTDRRIRRCNMYTAYILYNSPPST